jgi:acid phosphatase family membrane protein YuiD
VAATVVLQARTDLVIVAAILAAGVLYDAAYLRRRHDTHWILLDPLVDEPETATNLGNRPRT